MDYYLIAKTLHIVSVIFWMAGMLLTPLVIAAISRLDESVRTDAATKFRNIFRVMTIPAISAAWGSGIWIAVEMNYFSAPWMHAKLTFAFLLSALHGAYSGRLRRMARNVDYKPKAWLKASFGVQALFVLAIVYMVVAKPF